MALHFFYLRGDVYKRQDKTVVTTEPEELNVYFAFPIVLVQLLIIAPEVSK